MTNGRNNLTEALKSYEAFLASCIASESLLKNRLRPSKHFVKFAAEHNVHDPDEITRELIKEFQVYLYIDKNVKTDTVTEK